jgi:DnaJ-class molecular chaperone
MLKSTSSVTLEQSYDLLGLNQSASIDEIKQVYRQKAKAIHPDLNPDDVDAIDRFNTLNQAYQLLLGAARSGNTDLADSTSVATQNNPAATQVSYGANSTLTAKDLQLKQEVFDSLEQLVRQSNFTKAVSVIDLLARVIPNCSEVSKKRSEIYFKSAQHLVNRRTQLNLARTYLKESLKIDPHNQQRWETVNREFNRIDRLLK